MKKICLLSVIFILIDRVIKILVQSFLTSKGIYLIDHFFYVTYVKNDGAAFSILEGKQVLLIILGILASILIVYYVKKSNSKNIGYSLLLGGIIGNVIDRMVFGFVIDYLGFIIFNKVMPIFNFADMLIVFGAILILFDNKTNKKE